MVRLLAFIVLAAATVEVVSAAALPTPPRPAEVTIWRRNDGPLSTIAATAVETAFPAEKTTTEIEDGEDVPNDDTVTGEDDDVFTDVAVALLAAWLIKTVAGDRHAWVGNAVLQAESTLLHASLTSSYVLPMKNVAQVSAAWDGA
ncbi:hypothetical protein ANOM_006010 [Aspergillus nomiae NRRL 13137]|uniref:Uncharacterized protein n=1 Tax=Aspergillus nomiae NRRL (strain ATCC 15546 / NRRL 13137 / CBS 260.88 / M93) TaxID=1509407 RepID=A0A0L1J2B6_ASPN3|nr:uncharacterized protein ANOM_006010 [Aspergillus nomiae NRRL 13137]KNG85931.1 hypothetical protein ANOM_006010 [Aspergillus nomiae NRRL 13137]